MFPLQKESKSHIAPAFPEKVENKKNSLRKWQLPSSSQKEKPQSHVVSQMEAVVHLSAGLLVHETAKLKNFQVSRASHHHCKRQQQDAQARFEIIVTYLCVQQGRCHYTAAVKCTLLICLLGCCLPQSLKTTFHRKRESGETVKSFTMIHNPATFCKSVLHTRERDGSACINVSVRVIKVGRKLGRTHYRSCWCWQTFQEICCIFVLERKEMHTE